jgi:uncharacterized protein (DUF1015 family)
MAELLPFRALRNNPHKVADLDRVVTQPYDKIDADMQERYYAASPYNLVRIIRGRQNPADTPRDNVYSRATRDFHDWIAERALVADPEPALYPYTQEYALPGQPGVRKQRRGFVALCRLEDYSAGVVHRHEETLVGPKADRLELLKATRAHFGQIFMIYSDPTGSVEQALAAGAKGNPSVTVHDEYGTHHSLWRVTEAAVIGGVLSTMRDKKVVIADGHHRYETALAYRDYCRAQGRRDERSDYVMVTLIRKESEGLTILPTHRVVYGLPDFDWPRFAAGAEQFFNWEDMEARSSLTEWAGGFIARLAETGREAPSLGAYSGSGKLALLRLRKDLDLGSVLGDAAPGLQRLDVVLLHRLLLEGVLGIDRQAVREERNLRYVREFEQALQGVESGRDQLCFLMNPTPIDAVWENALAGQPLPQKSTDFYPKLLSGLTAYWLDNPAGI